MALEIHPTQFEGNDGTYIYIATKTKQSGGWIVHRRLINDPPIPPRTQYLSVDRKWIHVLASEQPDKIEYADAHILLVEASKIA